MHFKFRNVNDAFTGLVRGIHEKTIPTTSSPSRNGDVLTIDEPVIVEYTHPRERVLFNPARDCNPFFHMFESLWMLAGRNDVESIAYFNSGVRNYSDDSHTLNGAYGKRWREASSERYDDIDQLDFLINHLKNDPNSRRAVLQMWNVQDDLAKIGNVCDCEAKERGRKKHLEHCSTFASKDVCCNTNVYFRIRYESRDGEEFRLTVPVLDMTVCNRSNDIVWGMLGANVVHMSFLQEYVAAGIGVEVGKYYQMSNNLHAYTWNWQPNFWLSSTLQQNDYVELKPMVLVPLVKNRETFDKECKQFVEGCGAYEREWTEPFLRDVALPMVSAFKYHKARVYDRAEHWLNKIEATDWRIDCERWIAKRRLGWESKQEDKVDA